MEAKVYWCYLLFVQLISSTHSQTSSPVILTEGQEKTASPGQDVIFECQVTNLGSHKVTWTFLTHQLTISDGAKVVQNQQSKYGLAVDEPTGTYNLIINDIANVDRGDYQCLVDDTRVSVTHHLYVAGSETYPTTDPDGTPANFTDCCINEGVTSPCLPLCSPSTFIFDGFNSSVCAADLLKLLKCGSDGRNHVTCCRQRQLPDLCLDYCLGQVPTAPVIEQAVCLDRALDIIDCFEEGQGILPSPPLFPQASGQSSTEIKVSWSKPVDGGDKVKKYKIFQQKDGDDVWQASDPISANTFTSPLVSLQPATEYSIYVISIGDHGASLPSFIVKTWTFSNTQLPPDTTSEVLLACCKKRGVTSGCQSFLCAGTYQDVSTKDKISCYTQVDKVYSCLADEKDHKACCALRGLPDRCLKLCQGSLIDTTFTDIDCLNYMPEVASCIQENKGNKVFVCDYRPHCLNCMPEVASCIQENKDTIPGPPGDIQVREVTSSSAVISWTTPTQNPDKLDSYILVYKEYYSGLDRIIAVTNNSLTLEDLEPYMFYEVKVKSVGNQGTSMSSESIIFLTYYEHGGVLVSTPLPVSTTMAPPHTVQDCCQASGVLPQCQPLCNYTADHSSFDVTLLFSCEASIGPILQCAVDGRNHEGCCKQRGLSDYCLKYCSFSKEDAQNYQITVNDFECIFKLDEAIQCMQEGVENIPSAPRDVSVVAITEYSVSLQWNIPAQNADKVIGYRVYWENLDTHTNHTIVRLDTAYIIQNLLSDNSYKISVTAYGSAGASLPSATFTVRIKAINKFHGVNVTLSRDMTDCCAKGNVSTSCLPMCSGSQLVNLHECGGEMGVVLECASDQKDHTACCKREQIADHCLQFCTGDINVRDFTSLICMGFTEQILACFREGNDKLPSTPGNFHVREVSSQYITVGWEASTEIAVPIVYLLYYKEQRSQGTIEYLENVTSPYKLENLQPFTHYELYVVAVNVYGASPPTPIITVWTQLEEGPTIEVRQDPSGVLHQGTSGVSLTCSSTSQPEPSIYWKRNNLKLLDTGIYTIDTLKKEDTGKYVCVATSSGLTAVADHYLKVMYDLEVTALSNRVEVAPSRGLTALLQCDFKGQPQSIKWLKDGRTFPPVNDTSNRLVTSSLIKLDQGITSSQLIIYQVRRADYGQYTCFGKNDFGPVHAQIDLVNSEPEEEPSLTPAPPVNNVKDCCDNKNVQDKCLDACSFDVDFNEILTSDNPNACIPDLPNIVGCAADGRNHTLCCVNADVPPICLPYCLGIVEQLDEQHLICISFFETIINCVEEGLEKIPDAPRDIQARLTQGYIEVSWTEPAKNPEYVTSYDIHYKVEDEQETVKTVNYQAKRVYLRDIRSYKTYTIYVVASNHHGNSHPSNVVHIATLDQIPGSPVNLLAPSGPIFGTQASLHWSEPQQNPGAVQVYQVYYGKVGEKDKKMVSTKETQYLLSGLELGTSYAIYVTAKTDHTESNRSNTIVVTTSKAPTTQTEDTVTPEPQVKSASNKESVGIGVGVTLVVILLALIVLVIAFFLVRRLRDKHAHTRFTDSSSVVFENSGFSKPAHVEIAEFGGETSTDFRESTLRPSDYQPTEKGHLPPPQHNSSVMNEERVSHSNGTAADPSSEMMEVGNTVQGPFYATLEADHQAVAVNNGSLNPGFHSNNTGKQ